MGHTINYVNTDTPETVQKALDDCKAYLGHANYANLCQLLADAPQNATEQDVRFSLMMLGLQGYPVTAMMDTFWRK